MHKSACRVTFEPHLPSLFILSYACSNYTFVSLFLPCTSYQTSPIESVSCFVDCLTYEIVLHMKALNISSQDEQCQASFLLKEKRAAAMTVETEEKNKSMTKRSWGNIVINRRYIVEITLHCVDETLAK